MKFTVEKHEKYALISIGNENLDTLVAPELKSEFVMFNTAGIRNIILDLSEVQYADSSGLSAILVGNRLCGSVKGSFVLAKVHPNVMNLIRISKLDNILSIVPSVEEATDLVFIEEIERELGDSSEDEQ